MDAAPPPVPLGCALFIDFDGTLIELAERPDRVRVPPEVPTLLRALRARLDGAVAILTGRKLESLDRHLAPLKLPAAGIHGHELRIDGATVHRGPDSLGGVAAQLRERFDERSGVLIEDKGAAVAIHYRGAAQRAVEAEHALREAVRGMEVAVVPGKFVFEARPRTVDKGLALREFMQHAPFAGRRPVFAGDDVTDEDAILQVQKLGGIAVKVGEGMSAARYRLDSPRALYDWLADSLRVMNEAARLGED